MNASTTGVAAEDSGAGIPGLRLVVVIGLLLCLLYLEVIVQSVKTLFPEPAVLLHPNGRVAVEVVQFFTANFARRDQARFLQDAQVLHDTKTGHGQGRTEFGEGLPAGLKEQIEQMAAMVISQRLEHMFYIHGVIIRYQMVTCQKAKLATDIR